MNTELKQEMRDALWAILDGDYDKNIGICANLVYSESLHDYCWAQVVDPLKVLFKKWPYYSGDHAYPIKGIENKDPSDAFDYEKLWEGKYGESRIQLVMFLLEQLGEPE